MPDEIVFEGKTYVKRKLASYAEWPTDRTEQHHFVPKDAVKCNHDICEDECFKGLEQSLVKIVFYGESKIITLPAKQVGENTYTGQWL